MYESRRNVVLPSLLVLAFGVAGIRFAVAQTPADYSPNPVPLGEHQSIKFTGTDFQDKLTVALEDPNGKSVSPQATSIKPPTEVNVTADLTVAGSWKATFKNPGGQASPPFSFRVQEPPPEQHAPSLKITGIIPVAPVLAPNQALTFTGVGFGSDQKKLTVSVEDPQGYKYSPTEVLDVKDDRVVVVCTFGTTGKWKATISRAADNGKVEASGTLEFAVANVPPSIHFLSPAFVGFCLAAVVATALLGILVGFVIKWLGDAIRNGKWSLSDAVSEESACQPKVITAKSDVILLASTSRVIALLGLLGILTTVLGIGYSIMWNLFAFGTVPDLSQVRSFLYGSATLFAPYLFNQAREVFSPSVLPKSPEAGESKPEPAAAAIIGIAPSQPEAKTTVQTVRLTGRGFQPGLALTLVNPAGTPIQLPQANVESGDPTLVTAVASLDVPGNWTARVQNPGENPSADFGFMVSGAPSIDRTDPSTPGHNPNNPQPLAFIGSGFMKGLTVELTDPNAVVTQVPPSSVNVAPTRVSMSVTLGAQGTWSVKITNPGNHPASMSFQVG
jgi:hypothetical protein